MDKQNRHFSSSQDNRIIKISALINAGITQTEPIKSGCGGGFYKYASSAKCGGCCRGGGLPCGQAPGAAGDRRGPAFSPCAFAPGGSAKLPTFAGLRKKLQTFVRFPAQNFLPGNMRALGRRAILKFRRPRPPPLRKPGSLPFPG